MNSAYKELSEELGGYASKLDCMGGNLCRLYDIAKTLDGCYGDNEYSLQVQHMRGQVWALRAQLLAWKAFVDGQ